ncbi:MAG: Mu transposase domain-containing protein [Bacteroidota bacterium]
MTATDAQVRLLMKERSNGRTQQQAAVKVNLRSRKTVQKYEQVGQLPSELKEPRDYRTRPDPFEKDWSEIESKLAAAPELEAKAIFEWLCERDGAAYTEGQLRTLQRHVSNWRVLHSNPTLTLDQIHNPGEVLQSDGTCRNDLEVTLQGEPFEHILFHSVLPFSNWEWGRVVQSESLLSIRLGLQSTLLKLGYVPQAHQTDHTTAATYTLGVADRQSPRARGYNEAYLQLLGHYGLEARTIHLSSPNENGDVESSNGGLKRAVKQHLLLRGNRDFESVEAYETFLFAMMDKRNAGRQVKLDEEIAVMKPLTAKPWPPMRELNVRVGQNGILRVGSNGYSVPSGLKGKRVTARIYEWHIEVWYANQRIETLPRVPGAHHYQINYRHVIDSLLRKPGGFRNYRYRADLFPLAVFRQAWEVLNEHLPPRRADLIYLRILKQAALGLEADVAQALTLLLEQNQTVWDENTVLELTGSLAAPRSIPELAPQTANLSLYDQFLQIVSSHASA